MWQTLTVLVTLLMTGSSVWAQTMPPIQGPSGPTAQPTPAVPRELQPMAVQGRIKSLDRSAKTMTLEDGTALTIPQSVATTGLQEGERVIVTYERKGEEKLVTSVIQVREPSES